MESFSFLDLVLHNEPGEGVAKLGFHITYQWFALLYPWSAMVLIYWISRKSRYTITDCWPIVVLGISVPVHGWVVWKYLTTRLSSQSDADAFMAMFLYGIWPLYIVLGFGSAWVWYKWHRPALGHLSGRALLTLYGVLIYHVLKPAVLGYHGHVVAPLTVSPP